MKNANRFLLWAVMPFAFLCVSVGQALTIPNVPDVQQPPAGSLGNPVNNACAPVSAVNITRYWDVVIGHPNATMVNAGLVPTVAADYLYYFMNTNDWTLPPGPPRMNGASPMFPSAPGTYNIDIMPAFYEFVRWDAGNLFITPPPPLPIGNLGYNWIFTTDFAAGFGIHKAEIDSGRPDIVCFTYWNPMLTPVKIFDPAIGDTVYFYMWGPPTSSSGPPNPVENWNSNTGPEGIGHAVTGVGYYANFSPGGGLPITNWIVCHDNWPTTTKNVAIPWLNWKATITANPGEIIQPPDSLYWKDYNGPDTANGYMPDFDQKQDFTGDGLVDPGYCGPVSVANSLWWFQGKFPNREIINPIFYPGNPAGFIQFLATLMKTNHNGPPPYTTDGTYIDSMQFGIQQYLNMMGLNDLLYEHTVRQPTFEFVEAEIERCQDVTLLIGFWVVEEAYENPPGSGNYMVMFHRTGGHYVTSAGVNSQDHFIGLSDPYFDNFESGATFGVLRGLNHNHPLGHNDGISASHDISNINDSVVCSPGGVWELDHSFWHSPSLQSQFIAQNEDTLRLMFPWPPLCPTPPVVGTLLSEVEAAIIVSPYETTPKINVIPDTLSYVQLVNTTNTYIDQIVICNVGTAALSVDSLKCDLSWVTTSFLPISLLPGSCDTVDVAINTAALAAGLYAGNFHVYSNDLLTPIINKPYIRVRVTAPNIQVNPDSLYHAQLVNTIVTYNSDFAISNTGDGNLQITSATNTKPWITLLGVPAIIPPAGSSPINVRVNTNGIAAGIYLDSVTITSNDPARPILRKPKIVIRVTAPSIQVVPDSLYHAQLFNTLVIYNNDFSIRNNGDGNLQIASATNTLPWITLQGVPASIPPAGNSPINVRVNTTGIAPGTYLDSVTITSNDPIKPILRKPKIVIKVTTPNIQVIPDSLYHSQLTNTNTTYNNDFVTRNNGDGDLQITGATNTLPWITLIGVPALIPPLGQNSINVNVNTTGIAPGIYLDSVTILSNDPTKPILRKPKIVIQVTQVQQDSLFWKDYNDQAPEGYMPDFDQNQDFNADGLIEMAYCGPVAVANSFWWYQGKNPTKLIIPPTFYPGNPLGFVQMLAQLMKTNITGPGTLVDSMQAGIGAYLNLMHLDSMFYEHTILQPTFDTVANELIRCQDVTLLVGIWVIEDVIPGGPGQWIVNWRRAGGHYITMAGVNRNAALFGISDPDNDNFELGICNGVMRGLNHIHPAGHNDGVSASHDIYNVGTPPCSPAGLWEIEHPFWRSQQVAFRYQYQNGGMYMTMAPWQCPWLEPAIGMIYSEIEAAVIVSPVTGCDFMPGDANGNHIIQASDVTFLVRYLKGVGNPPPDSCWNDSTHRWLYSAADANGNCLIQASDVTFLVAYFRGLQPAIRWCPQTPPMIIPPAALKPNNDAIEPIKMIPNNRK